MADERINREEVRKTIKELKFYFDEVGEIDEDGEYIIYDIEPLKEKAKNDETAQEILDLYEKNKDVPVPEGVGSYVSCIVDKFVASYGDLFKAFFKGAILDYIKKKQWLKAAKLLVKSAAKAGFKGSAVSLAASLALYAAQCGFE